MENILKKYKFNENKFNELKNQFLEGKFNEETNILKEKVEPADNSIFNDITEVSEKDKLFSIGKKAIENNELCVVIMNGGMATRFGGVVKGIVPVFDNKSFINIKFDQIKRINAKYNVKIPIYLMNSFATNNSTIKHLEENNYFGYPKDKVSIFTQFISKRILKNGQDYKSLSDEMKNYYSPGHGDFLYAINESKVLDSFIKNSGKYIWYSNVDNLGAVIDELILGIHIDSKKEMTAEMAKKYDGDKGGAPALVNGKLQIVEGFKFPKDFDQDDIRVFNTATYIFNAKSLKKDIELPWYFVNKNVDNTDIVQFERLAGDLSIFLDSNYIIVEREKRFFPIKTPKDLEDSRDKLKKMFG